MPGSSAIIFVRDDTSKTGYSYPLMLHNILGTPLLSWLVSSLVASGCGRFFLVCHEQYHNRATPCFPETVALTVPDAQNISDCLHVFLSTADTQEEDLLVVTAPVIYAPDACSPLEGGLPPTSGVFSIDCAVLMSALDEDFQLFSFLQENGHERTDSDGFFAITSGEALAAWQARFAREKLSALIRAGVEIPDLNNCYVEPNVFVGSDTILLPGTVLRGNTIVGRGCRIGPNTLLESSTVSDGAIVSTAQVTDSIVGFRTVIGPYAQVHAGSVLGNDVTIGSFSIVENAIVQDGARLNGLCYLGESDVGRGATLGCGTVTASFDRANTHRTVIDEAAFIGSNTSLIAPVTVGRNAYVAAGTILSEDVPENALAIARARQTGKKDWSSKNKIPH